MPKLDQMTVALDYPVADVFALMADADNERDWNPDLTSIRRLTEGPVGAGTEWEGSYRGMGSMRVRLDEYVPTSRLVFSTTGPRLDMTFVFGFTGAGRRTVFTADADIRLKGATKLLTPLVGPMLRRTFTKQRPAQIARGLAQVRNVSGGAQLP